MELVDRLDNVVGKRLVDVERQVSYLGRVVPIRSSWRALEW